jgi:hypothetical protein
VVVRDVEGEDGRGVFEVTGVRKAASSSKESRLVRAGEDDIEGPGVGEVDGAPTFRFADLSVS